MTGFCRDENSIPDNDISAPVGEGDAIEALRPFAALADEIEKCAADTGTSVEDWAMSCAWDDLVRARAALTNGGDRVET